MSHRCLRNFQCRHYYKSWWLQVTEWSFAFVFFKQYTSKTGVLARWLFAFVFKDLCTENPGEIAEEMIKATEK